MARESQAGHSPDLEVPSAPAQRILDGNRMNRIKTALLIDFDNVYLSLLNDYSESCGVKEPPIRESIGLTVPVAGAVRRHQSPACAWSENQFSRLTRSRSLLPGLKYAACRAGSATADPVRGLRATRARRKRSEKLAKPRISIRPPSARHAVICSSIVCTASATSRSPRWDCLRAIRSINSDFVNGPLSHCRARAVGPIR